MRQNKQSRPRKPLRPQKKTEATEKTEQATEATTETTQKEHSEVTEETKSEESTVQQESVSEETSSEASAGNPIIAKLKQINKHYEVGAAAAKKVVDDARKEAHTIMGKSADGPKYFIVHTENEDEVKGGTLEPTINDKIAHELNLAKKRIESSSPKK